MLTVYQPAPAYLSCVRVLDIARGTGALAAAAARRGASIIGMDFAPTMIAEAIRRGKFRNAQPSR